MLNDGVNSLARYVGTNNSVSFCRRSIFRRMYSSTFADWFSQAVIDFMLGNRTMSVFSEFLLKLQSTDPRELIRISKIRADAIATCVSRVLPEGERLLSGWTLFAPEELNVKVGDKFEEKVLLLVRGFQQCGRRSVHVPSTECQGSLYYRRPRLSAMLRRAHWRVYHRVMTIPLRK